MLELRFTVENTGDVSALLQRPEDARSLLVFGHGAGAGMRHAFMTATAERLAERGVATLRYQFPYMEKGSRRPDSRAVLLATARRAVEVAREQASDLPLFAGGKSMGGRMSSQAAAEADLRIAGLVFFGFPLHPSGKPSTGRGDHLVDVNCPMLFLQGTRDKLGEMELLRPICERLPKATLHVVDGADHSFGVLKRSGRTPEEVLDELADTAAGWMRGVV